MILRLAILVLILITTPLVPGSASAAYPGANGLIVVEKSHEDPIKARIYQLMRFFPDGKYPRHYWTGPDDPEIDNTNFIDQPTYSPMGRRLAFTLTAWNEGGEDIWIANADDTNWRRITHHPASDRHPTWSPDGRSIAFVSSRSGVSHLYIKRIGSKGPPRVLEKAGPHVGDIAWSPAGDRIAFLTWDPEDGPGVSDVWTIKTDGTDLQQVTNDGYKRGHIDWAPDGTKILYDRTRPNEATFVVTSDLSSGDVDVIAEGGMPVFSPNGKQVLYFGEYENELYLLRKRVGGKGVVPIRPTHYNGMEAAQPSWQPRRPTVKSSIHIRTRTKSDSIEVMGAPTPRARMERVRFLLRLASTGEQVLSEEILTGPGGGIYTSIPRAGNRACTLTARFMGDARLLPSVTRVETRC